MNKTINRISTHISCIKCLTKLSNWLPFDLKLFPCLEKRQDVTHFLQRKLRLHILDKAV